MEHLTGHDAWKTTEPDHGNGGASLSALFWRGFKFAQRQGNAEDYLHIYRGVPMFAELVARAEQMLAHPEQCDCQLCRGAA